MEGNTGEVLEFVIKGRWEYWGGSIVARCEQGWGKLVSLDAGGEKPPWGTKASREKGRASMGGQGDAWRLLVEEA